MTRSRLVPAIIMKFEAELYQKINDRLLTNPMSFDTVKDAKARLIKHQKTAKESQKRNN